MIMCIDPMSALDTDGSHEVVATVASFPM